MNVSYGMMVMRSRRDGSVERFINLVTNNYSERTVKLRLSGVVANALHNQQSQGIVYVLNHPQFEVLDSHGFVALSLIRARRAVFPNGEVVIDHSGFKYRNENSATRQFQVSC